jgi:uncharacterized membrane protein YqjE
MIRKEIDKDKTKLFLLYLSVMCATLLVAFVIMGIFAYLIASLILLLIGV